MSRVHPNRAFADRIIAISGSVREVGLSTTKAAMWAVARDAASHGDLVAATVARTHLDQAAFALGVAVSQLETAWAPGKAEAAQADAAGALALARHDIGCAIEALSRAPAIFRAGDPGALRLKRLIATAADLETTAASLRRGSPDGCTNEEAENGVRYGSTKRPAGSS